MTTFFVVALGFLLTAGVLTYIRIRTLQRQQEEKRLEALQAARIRMAEQRIASNGGRPLSAHKGGIPKN